MFVIIVLIILIAVIDYLIIVSTDESREKQK